MTTQSRMFFVKSFKGFRPLRRAACGLKTTYTKRNCMASKYISGLPSRQQPEELPENLLLADVALHELHPGKLGHGEQVRGDDPAGAPHPPAGVLTPRFGCGSQVKAGLSGLQQVFAAVDFLELEHRARAPALALGPLHERIREVLPQPPVAALGTPAHRFSRTPERARAGRGAGGGARLE